MFLEGPEHKATVIGLGEACDVGLRKLERKRRARTGVWYPIRLTCWSRARAGDNQAGRARSACCRGLCQLSPLCMFRGLVIDKGQA